MSQPYIPHRRKNFAGPPPPAGPVAFTGSSTTFVYSGSDTTSNSFSHNRSAATQGGLQIEVMTRFPPNSVTYNGVNLTLGRSDGFDQAGTSIWVGPNTLATGSNTVVINHSASQNACIMHCENLENFDQTTMVGNTNGESGANLGSSSLSTTISEGSRLVSCLGKKFSSPSLNGGDDQQSLMTVQGSNNIDGIACYSGESSAGSKNLAYNWSSSANTSRTDIELLNG